MFRWLQEHCKDPKRKVNSDGECWSRSSNEHAERLLTIL